MAYGTLNAGTITPGSGNTLTVSETVNVATSLQLAGTAITSTATEINLLDGSSATNATVSKAVVLDGSGNIALPTGKGIDFSATADGSGTTTSELLDDYEEGTWTPADTGGNITASAGWYTKIGNLVTCTARIATGSGTTQNPLTGLPFNAKAINDPGGGVITSDSSGVANTWTVAMLNGAATIRTLKNNAVVTLANSVTYDHITFSYYV